MSQKKYFSYIRVSTQRQGQHGTSLAEQQAAIERFSISWNLPIVKRFEERETAAKQGRPVFLDMLKQLKSGKANGVVIHKIDRSARNLKDWADLGNLIDNGLEVHFASESLDLSSRGGRLSADIQAVVASDYIRNLREETKKGLYGRLRQGLFPFRAVVGYLNAGGGKPKTIDPRMGPLIRMAFELYATGEWSLPKLSDHMYELGLRNRSGRKISINGLSTIFHNTFYYGMISIEKTGERFAGIHKPIIDRKLFNQVQDVLDGKLVRRRSNHFFLFRRLVRCESCNRSCIPERHKEYVYYRCQKRGCYGGSVREETIASAFKELLEKLQFSKPEYRSFIKEFRSATDEIEENVGANRQHLQMNLEKIEERLSRLADALLDGMLEKDAYIAKKNEMISDKQELQAKLAADIPAAADVASEVEAFLEMLKDAQIKYKNADATDRRDLVKSMVLKFDAMGKSVSIKPKSPFDLIAARPAFTAGSPCRGVNRKVQMLARKVVKHLIENPHSLTAKSIE